MGETFITADDLREMAGMKAAESDTRVKLAVDVACETVVAKCGPMLVRPITDELVEVAGSTEVRLEFRVRTLTAVKDARTGTVLTLTDWHAEGQVLKRWDRGPIYSDLLVTYDAGEYTGIAPDVTAPGWARSAALHIGQQWLRVTKRFSLGSNDQETAIGFLIPKAAEDEMHEHLLIQSIGGVG